MVRTRRRRVGLERGEESRREKRWTERECVNDIDR